MERLRALWRGVRYGLGYPVDVSADAQMRRLEERVERAAGGLDASDRVDPTP